MIAQAEFSLDFGVTLKGIQKFIHREIGDHKLSVFHGGGHGLAAYLDEAIHIGLGDGDIADIQLYAVLGEERHGLTTPRAAALYVKDGERSLGHIKMGLVGL